MLRVIGDYTVTCLCKEAGPTVRFELIAWWRYWSQWGPVQLSRHYVFAKDELKHRDISPYLLILICQSWLIMKRCFSVPCLQFHDYPIHSTYYSSHHSFQRIFNKLMFTFCFHISLNRCRIFSSGKWLFPEAIQLTKIPAVCTIYINITKMKFQITADVAFRLLDAWPFRKFIN